MDQQSLEVCGHKTGPPGYINRLQDLISRFNPKMPRWFPLYMAVLQGYDPTALVSMMMQIFTQRRSSHTQATHKHDTHG